MKISRELHWGFFLVTFLWSWGFWLVPVTLGIEPVLAKVFYALGGIAPTATGIILAYRKRDEKYWKDFWHRILSFRQISLKWHLLMVLFFPALSIISILVNYLFVGTLPELTTLKDFLLNPVHLISFAFFTIFFGPLPEEIGWRGFALDHLERRYSWFGSSIILGFFWAMWHIPMFFIEGTYQYGLMHQSPAYALAFLAAFFPVSVIMDWIYNNNGRSILSGILFHFYTNFFGEIIDLPNEIKQSVSLAILLIVAIFILVSWRRRSYWQEPVGEFGGLNDR